MKWEADQRMGFFGWTPPTRKGATGQPRHAHLVLDIEEAISRVADVLAVWREVAAWPDSPPFSGGIFDAWPHRLARGLAVAKAEAMAVREWLRHEEAKTHG